MRYEYDMSEQERVDRKMCKPGYTWNETLQKCLGFGDTSSDREPGETSEGAIRQELGLRKAKKTPLNTQSPSTIATRMPDMPMMPNARRVQ